MLVIEIVPFGAERFKAYLDKRLLCTSRQPLLDSARVLLADGLNPSTLITMRHRGGNSMDGLTADIGRASKLMVEENNKRGPRFVRWKPFPKSAKSGLA